MKAEERRKAIAAELILEHRPIAGSVLAARYGVSRQIIVQDISTLKAEGYDILSTHYGYLIKEKPLCLSEGIISRFDAHCSKSSKYLII